MMHSPVIRTIAYITWVITAIVSINVLTASYEYDMFEWVFKMMPGAGDLIIWIIGLSGVISLALFIKMMFMACPVCGACPCICPTTNKTSNF